MILLSCVVVVCVFIFNKYIKSERKVYVLDSSKMYKGVL